MKKLKFLFLFVFLVVVIFCIIVRVVIDYDWNVNFGEYIFFVFYKLGIDKVKISDLDKKRIFCVIDVEFFVKGI